MCLEKNSVIQPFNMEIVPIKKLVLFNFEKNPETIYEALELQYLITNHEGKGYRVIAYRKDKYVDVYDEQSLCIKEVGNFEVCENGLKNYLKVHFKNTIFETTSEGLYVAFSFQDYKGRKIEVCVREHSKKKSVGFDLIAPIGSSSINPVNLPIFAMYDFDLVRKKNTEFKVAIDGKEIVLDPFPVPVPKDGQMRSFVRYSQDCELIEFGKSGEHIITPKVSNGVELYSDGLVAKYQRVENNMCMKALKFEKSDHPFQIEFEEALPDLMRMADGEQEGKFTMKMRDTMGYLSGDYKVEKQKDQVKIEMIPTDGWIVQNKTLLTKLMLQKKSLFCTWPKKYYYKQTIDLHTGKSTCNWERINYKAPSKEWWKDREK